MIGQLAYRVLVVDDEPLARKFLSSLLVGAGYVVRTAIDGIDAVGELRGSPIDLVICDLHMPRMSGLEFLGIVRRRFPQIPAIAFSGEASPPEGLAADMYFQKSAEGLQDFIPAVSCLIRNPPSRESARKIDSEPKSPVCDSQGHFRLSCPDCLRSFEVLDGGKLWRGKQTSICPSCGGIVWFAVAAGAAR